MTHNKHWSQPFWERIVAVPAEHRLFREISSGRIGIADGSGATPDETDDGTLYVDEKRPILIDAGNPDDIGKITCTIPLLTPDGKRCSTPESLDGCVAIARVLCMRLEIRLSDGERLAVNIDL